MKIFDLHADIGFDIYEKHRIGERNVFMNHHYDKLLTGDFFAVCVASYFEGNEDWKDMQACLLAVKKDLAISSKINQVLSKDDFQEDRLNVLMTVEGMCGIKEDVEESINWLYQQGVRIASLTWNEANSLATGALADASQGLSSLGKTAIREMNRLDMIIDVSHTNEKSFWQILDCSKKAVIATHSNARQKCMSERSLTDQQIKALAAQNGLIGVVAAKNFIARTSAEQNAYQLALHASHIAELVGVKHVAIGFDFMDFCLEEGWDSAMATDLPDATAAQNFIAALQKVGFSDQDVESIAWRNAYKFMSDNL